MKQAIQKAIEGGWKYPRWFEHGYHTICVDTYTADQLFNRWVLLDPFFWQCLGKSLGKIPDVHLEPLCRHKLFDGSDYQESVSWWIVQMHRFVGHIVEGKDAESFFKKLLE